MVKPLAIDLCCGLGGWTDGLLEKGWDVVGFDIERHEYGDHKYPAQLVLQDIRTLSGEQFRRKVSLVVASPPCQFFSYCAMLWSRAKALAAEVRADPVRLEQELELFKACVRIGREAECPIIIENVRGAQPWVGRARFSFGSFYLWGDVPALMPITFAGIKAPGMNWSNQEMRGQDFTRIAAIATKVPGFRFDGSGRSSQTASVNGIKGVPHRTAGHWTNPAEHEGVKCGGDWFNNEQPSISRLTSSRSPARKAASAMIAKIPAPLARHIASVFYPR